LERDTGCRKKRTIEKVVQNQHGEEAVSGTKMEKNGPWVKEGVGPKG